MNPIDNSKNVIVEMLVRVDVVHIDRQLILHSMKDILDRSINRIVRGPKRKSMTRSDNQIEYRGMLVRRQIIHSKTPAISLSAMSNLLDHIINERIEEMDICSGALF